MRHLVNVSLIGTIHNACLPPDLVKHLHQFEAVGMCHNRAFC